MLGALGLLQRSQLLRATLQACPFLLVSIHCLSCPPCLLCIQLCKVLPISLQGSGMAELRRSRMKRKAPLVEIGDWPLKG